MYLFRITWQPGDHAHSDFSFSFALYLLLSIEPAKLSTPRSTAVHLGASLLSIFAIRALMSLTYN